MRLGMGTTYRGDSDGKRFARFVFWSMILHQAMQGRDPTKATYLYLASFEGGDASVLSAFGIPPSQQLAVDLDADSLHEFHRRHPDVPIALGDVADVAERLKQRFDCVFLDYCGRLSDSLLRTTARVTRCACDTRTGVMSLAYMRGREQENFASVEAKRGKASPLGAGLVGQRIGAHPERIEDGRHEMLLANLNARLLVDRKYLITYRYLTYQSTSPMAISTFAIGAHSKGLRLNEMPIALKAAEHYAAIRNATDATTDATRARVSEIPYQVDLRSVARKIRGKYGFDTRRTALALNLPIATVSAWKAHDTRNGLTEPAGSPLAFEVRHSFQALDIL